MLDKVLGDANTELVGGAAKLKVLDLHGECCSKFDAHEEAILQLLCHALCHT